VRERHRDRVWDEIANPLIATYRVSERCGCPAAAACAPPEVFAVFTLGGRKWLGREDSNLEFRPERCGTESGRPSVGSSLIFCPSPLCIGI
jgi:hypothetical protein